MYVYCKVNSGLKGEGEITGWCRKGIHTPANSPYLALTAWFITLFHCLVIYLVAVITIFQGCVAASRKEGSMRLWGRDVQAGHFSLFQLFWLLFNAFKGVFIVLLSVCCRRVSSGVKGGREGEGEVQAGRYWISAISSYLKFSLVVSLVTSF